MPVQHLCPFIVLSDVSDFPPLKSRLIIILCLFDVQLFLMAPLIFVGLVGVLCLISGASWKSQTPTGKHPLSFHGAFFNGRAYGSLSTEESHITQHNCFLSP
jgi:hypothetical protein